MSHIHYLKDVPSGAMLLDTATHACVVDRHVFEHIGNYTRSQPTSPSPGRIYRKDLNWPDPDAPNWFIYVTELDPEDPKFVLHHWHEVLFA